MRSLLTFTTLVAGVGGVLLVIAPPVLAFSVLGIFPIGSAADSFGRLAGAALISFALAAWFSRSNDKSARMVKIMPVYNFTTSIVIVYSVLTAGQPGLGLWLVLLLYVGLSAWWLMVLFQKPGHTNTRIKMKVVRGAKLSLAAQNESVHLGYDRKTVARVVQMKKYRRTALPRGK